MSIFASILRSVYKLSGAKKAFALPEDALRKEIEKQNRHRGVFTPTDRKAYYETITVDSFPCLIVRENPKPSERAILYFFGGGMVIGPDKGDLPVMRKLCRETGCDVWFPFYPLCMEYCITETYAMVYECYRKMIALYGGGNVSTCGFSSGGALALGIAAHNNVQPEPLPQPRHIVAVSPARCRGTMRKRRRCKRSMKGMFLSTMPSW
ncbi:MAG: alpha/beta hydrolase [Blautia sp.]